MILLVMGPQGSGKGTQASLLAKDFNLYYFDAGEFLRKIAEKDPKIDEIINKRGELLDDTAMFDLVRKHFEQKGIYDNIIFDGYPRSIAQYELLSDWLKGHGACVSHAIYIDVSRDTSIKRLSARRIDEKTGEIYNLLTNPPGKEINEKDLVQREDDKPEAIGERLAAYEKVTVPLIKHLDEKGILVKVNGEQTIETINKEIKEKLKNG